MSKQMNVREAASRDARKAVVGAARALRQRQTESEHLLWDALRDRRLAGHKFRRQARIGQFVVDFYCAAEHLVIEVDGDVHLQQQRLDQERQQMLEQTGLRVLRISADACEERIGDVLREIRAAFSVAAQPLPSPSERERGQG